MYDLNVTILLIFFFIFRLDNASYSTRILHTFISIQRGTCTNTKIIHEMSDVVFLYIYMQVPRVQSVVYNEFFEQLPERSVSFDVRLKFFRVKNAAHQCSHVISYTISELFSLRTPSPRSHRCRGDRVTSKKMIRHVLPYNKS